MQALAIILAVTLLPPVPGRITPDLEAVLSQTAPDQKIVVIVHMNTEYPYAEIASLTNEDKCAVMKDVALNSQQELVDYLRSLPVNQAEMGGQFWIFNGFHLKATPAVIRTIAQRPDVWFVCSNATVQLEARQSEEEAPNLDAIEWNILKIKADSCWYAGYYGQNIIVGHVDTGVMTTHAALTGKWLSPYWIDGVNGQSTPYDDHSHGTHTMGTICGGDGPGSFTNDIGVAYGLRFIPTKAFNSSGSGQYTWIDTCMHYLANLKAGGVDIRAIGNSWGSSSGSELHYWTTVLNWKTLGVFPVFSNGNSGPGAGTVGAPGSYPLSCGVGATNSSDAIASFSSRGPAPNINPINDPTYWYYSTWNLLKPDVSAPGVSIRSSLNNGSYGSMDGTSMASPHVTGGAAVLLSKNPSLTPTDLYNLFRNYCDQPSGGGTYPNNNYGWGRINLYRSLQNVPSGNAPNVTLNRTAVVNDGNGNGKLDPGENAGIVAYLQNTGAAAATNTQAVLRTSDSYITISDSTYTFGTIPAGDSANNSADPFDLAVAGGCPVGHVVNFNLYIVCAESSWTRPFSLTVGTPGLDYATHDVGNCKLTITRYGSIGFMESGQINGAGFVYPASGTNKLFYSSFAIATGINAVCDRYYDPNQVDDDDWVTTTNPDGKVVWEEPGPNNRDEYSTAMYDDSGAETVNHILCTQTTWAWDDATANDFVIMKFLLTNQGSSAVNNIYTAIFVDFDISTNGASDYGGSETARNLTWMYQSSPYVGVEILDPPRSTAAANLVIINNPTYVYPSSGMPDTLAWKFMNGTITNPSGTTAADWSICNSTAPFNLNPGESHAVAYAIIGGTNLADFQANADTAYQRYWNWGHASEGMPVKGPQVRFQVAPHINRNGAYTISYALPVESALHLTVYDISGRNVYEQNWQRVISGQVSFELPAAAQGVYFARIEAGGHAETVKLIQVR